MILKRWNRSVKGQTLLNKKLKLKKKSLKYYAEVIRNKNLLVSKEKLQTNPLQKVKALSSQLNNQ
jgi:hypothetical protein